MTAEGFCTGNPAGRSKNLTAINIDPVSTRVPHGVYVHSWLDVTVRHSADIQLHDAFWQDLNQYGKEDEKDWIFQEVLLTYLLPLYFGFGQESLRGLCRLREGTPILLLT